MQPALNTLMMEWPTNWSLIFGQEQPLIVEIGFGNGDYLIALAQAHPDHNIIGFELSLQSLEKAEKKVHQQQLDNARVIYSRGETAINHLFTPQSIYEIHINYPDPWFKTRHAGRRIMQADMLLAMTSRLQIGGHLFLATDILEYAQMSHELFAQALGLDNQLPQKWLHHLPERLITTKYEQKGFDEGRRGHYFKYRRNTVPIPDIPVKVEWSMPHIVMKIPAQPQAIVTVIEQTAFHKGHDIHVALLNAYWNPQKDTILLEVNIEEPTIEQHIALMLRYRREKEDYILRYATFGMPRSTEGVHFATNAIANWLMTIYEDASIVSNRTKR